MNFNFRGIAEILVIVALLIGAAALLSSHAAAAENGTENLTAGYVIVDTPLPDLIPIPMDHIPRIGQGETVYLNDTVDISGVSGWSGSDGEYRIAWYGSYETAYSPYDRDPAYIMVLPGKYLSASRESQYRFYVDPDVFGQMTGYWYQFSSNISKERGDESAGNLRAFYVSTGYRKVFNTTSNQTEGYYEHGNYTEPVIKPAPLLPERHVADYVAARGQAITWPAGGYRLWLFGRVNGIYDDRDNVITIDQVESLEPGRYVMAVHISGNNSLYEASCQQISKDPCGTIIPGLYGKQPINITGKLPPTVMNDLKTILAGTDDSLFEYNVDLQEPFITIERADEMFLKNRTVLDVRGYTNVANGTPITVSLNEGKTYYKFIPLWSVDTVAVRDSPGNLSSYRAYVPIDWENLAADARNHTLTAKTAIGGSMQKDFKISIMPADSCQYPEGGACHTNVSLKYMEDRNPFVPKPTAEIRTVTVERTVVQIETVVTYVTPDVQDYGKVFEGGVWWVGTWIVIGILAVVGLFALCYIVWVWWRGRKE
jgi:hypothetical protein